MTLLELTIPFYTLLEEAALRKKVKCAELMESIKRAGFRCNLITIEVGSVAPLTYQDSPNTKTTSTFPRKT